MESAVVEFNRACLHCFNMTIPGYLTVCAFTLIHNLGFAFFFPPLSAKGTLPNDSLVAAAWL